MSAIEFEPFDPQFLNSAYEVYEVLRECSPVYRSKSGYWCISRYADVMALLNSPERLSSRPNQGEGFGVSTDIDPEAEPELFARLHAIVTDMPIDLKAMMGSRMLVSADPPHHSEMRRIVSRAFAPRRLDQWNERMESFVAECLGAVDRTRPWDLVSTLANPLPLRVIAEILKVEKDRRHDLKRWTDVVLTMVVGEKRGTDEAQIAMLRMLKEFATYFVPMIETRRYEPGTDLISDLVRAEFDETLNAMETLLFIYLMLVAGTETSANLIGNIVVSLLENPEQLDRLIAEPIRLDNTIEETFRYRSPAQYVFRETLTNVEVAGTMIPAGEMVCLLLGAANRDPRQFENPDRFDIARKNASSHVALGSGIHYCLGAYLGRREAHASLRALLPDLSEYALAETPLKRRESSLIYGYQTIYLAPISHTCAS